MNPYLSIVTAARNDETGNNRLAGVNSFVKGLSYLSAKFQLPLELIIVEWNPPADQPRFFDALTKPQRHDFLQIRFIEVPPSIHEKYSRGDVILLFEMIAKNVGIRRAKGEFVLCTNPDILISEELFREIAGRKLSPEKFYRANRCDIPREINPEWSYDELLDYAGKHILKRHGKDYRYHNIPPGAPSWVYGNKVFPRVLNKLARWKKLLLDNPLKTKFNDLDTNLAADFTLMSKKAWLDMDGYLELDLSSVNIDVFSIIAVASLGYEQYLFGPKACTYHLNHADEFDALTPLEKIKFYEQSPGVSYEIVWSMVMTMLKQKEKFNVNPPNWGYADENFQEVVW